MFNYWSKSLLEIVDCNNVESFLDHYASYSVLTTFNDRIHYINSLYCNNDYCQHTADNTLHFYTVADGINTSHYIEKTLAIRLNMHIHINLDKYCSHTRYI